MGRFLGAAGRAKFAQCIRLFHSWGCDIGRFLERPAAQNFGDFVSEAGSDWSYGVVGMRPRS